MYYAQNYRVTYSHINI